MNGKKVLFAAGAPFLILAAQAEAWMMNGPTEDASRQFEFARALGCNTIEVQVKWAQVEPRRDEYAMDWVRWVMEQARAKDLSLVLLWFGSNVVGKTDGEKGLRMVPEYVSADTKTYARLGIGLGGNRNVLDPADPDTLDREKKAFRKTLEAVRAEDREGRIVAWQILNEVGVWEHVVVPYPEGDLTRHLARTVEELARVEKEVHGVPAFTNFWEGLRGVDPPYFLAHCPSLDFVSPDLYGTPKRLFFSRKNYDEFRRIFLDALDRYSRGRNVFFLSETNTDAFYRADLSLVTLLGKAGGLGMDVWAMTTATPERGEPLVELKSGKLTPSGEKLREAYSAVGAAMGPIASWAGTERAAWFVSEAGGAISPLAAGSFGVEADARPGGAALVVALPSGDLAIVGASAKLRIALPSGFSPLVEEGSWTGVDRWEAARIFPASREIPQGVEIDLDRYTSLRVASRSTRK